MRINHNIAAMKANCFLGKNNNSVDKSLEKLSTGYRINRAADGAAGMAISRKMKTQIGALEQASRNAADGVSVIQTAEGALSEVHSMLQRMRELSVQAANGTMTNEDRESVQNEINELNNEIQRISETTEFNTKSLLDGSVDRKSFSDTTSVQLTYLSDDVTVKEYSVKVTGNPEQAVIQGAAGIAAGTAPEGTININGIDVNINQGDSLDIVFESIRNACESMDVTVQTVDASGTAAGLTAGSFLEFRTDDYGSAETLEIQCDNPELLKYLGLTNGSLSAQGVEAKVELGPEFNNTATAVVIGNEVTITDKNGFKMKLTIDGDAIPPTETEMVANIKLLDAGPITLQIGAAADQTMTVRIPEVSPKTLGIDKVNVVTETGASDAITVMDKAISEVSKIRAKLGAYQNRLEHTITNVDEAGLNMDEALSRIEDTDMAEEMTKYTQATVLVQAGTSMLAQANERPQTILSLLQG